MKNCDTLNTPCINRVVMCTATTCVKPQLEQPSPLTIEINEELFCCVVRMDICIGFTTNHTGGEEPTQFRIYGNGMIAGTNVGLSPAQFNEIIRVRAALGWDGKE
jgi:hypothetical protein